MNNLLQFSTRAACSSDVEFLFTLKKAAEFDLIHAVFGWDEKQQRIIHQDEWHEARPRIVEYSGNPVGSYLLQDKGDHFYFGRFFLLPTFHNKGIGSQLLAQCTALADHQQKPIKLCYLQGSPVARLYQRMGFEIIAQDTQFVTMQRAIKRE